MKTAPLSPDDPKLTAYALGELDFEEAARVAEAIKGNAAAQAAVEEIRALAGQLEGALENEPVISGAASVPAPTSAPVKSGSAAKVMQFPLVWVLALVAACIMLVIASLPPPVTSSTIDRSAPAQVAFAPPPVTDAVTPPTPTDAGSVPPVLPVADNRKRLLPVEKSDVKPAPLRDDGLERWRSLTAIDHPASDTGAGKGAAPAGPSTEPKSYQLADYMNRAGDKATAEPGEHAVTAQYEVVPVSTLEAAKKEAPVASSDTTDAPLLAMANPEHRELLTLKISYRLPAVDLAQSLVLPRLDPVVDLALADKDFKLAVAAAGLGKKLQEKPQKGSKSYDNILTWPDDKSEPLDDAIKPGHESLDTTKRTVD